MEVWYFEKQFKDYDNNFLVMFSGKANNYSEKEGVSQWCWPQFPRTHGMCSTYSAWSQIENDVIIQTSWVLTLRMTTVSLLLMCCSYFSFTARGDQYATLYKEKETPVSHDHPEYGTTIHRHNVLTNSKMSFMPRFTFGKGVGYWLQ